METDMEHGEVARECERAAEAMGVTSCIRVDCRRFGGRGGRFALFDVNMKPVCRSLCVVWLDITYEGEKCIAT
jgi:hypothetical protein